MSYDAAERPVIECFYDVEAPGSDVELPDYELDGASDITDDACTAA
jgi:hypothetical protein